MWKKVFVSIAWPTRPEIGGIEIGDLRLVFEVLVEVENSNKNDNVELGHANHA